jgi:NitT/TauT family transport system ATP-binding protein
MMCIVRQLNDVAFEFPGVPVLRDCSLSINRGEIIAVMGRSGIGKSTLLRLVAGLLAPSRGHAGWGVATQETPRIHMMYQKPLLRPHLNAVRNIEMAALIQGTNADARQLLKEVGLGDKCARRPRELSGGEQRRVALARALSTQPDLLLLDEPFAGVDEFTRIELVAQCRDVIREHVHATVLVTHHPKEALMLSTRVIALAGSPATIVSEFDMNACRPNHLTHKEDRLRKWLFELNGHT